MKSLRNRRGCTALGACVTAAVTLVCTPVTEAATPPSFACTANAVTAQIAGAPILNPITAGGSGKACQPAIAGLPNTGEALSLGAILKARTAYAVVDPGGDTPPASRPAAAAGIEGLELTLGNPVLGVGAARSQITASCAGGVAAFKPASEVASITLAGTPIVLDGVVQPITDALTDAVGALVSVRLNEVVQLPGGGAAVRAAHVTLLRGGTALADVIVAESRLELNGAACDKSTGPVPPGTTPPICPNGSVFDAANNVCVIPVPGSQTQTNPVGTITGPGSVVVGPPSKGPSGGTVVTLTVARKKFPTSPCVHGQGPEYVVVGTRKNDRITGTNRKDRIIGRGGRDRIDGGRNHDCVDGGAGRDILTGGQGNDRVFGFGSRDLVNGDAGNDRLSGGQGKDTLNAAYGSDRAYGGRGRDKINVATAGRKATVYGGKGFDKVRCNPREVGRMHGVERIIVTHRMK